MADAKISALTPVTTLDLADEMVVVDKSDTAQASSGSTRKVTVNALQKWRNLVDNGAGNIAQRSTGPGGTTLSGWSCVDRFQLQLSAFGTWSPTQTVDAPANTEFTKCLKFTATVADAAPAASDFGMITQGIEGQFLQHLLWGTAAAKPLIIGIWVKSNITATIPVELYRTETGARHMAQLLTINATNTWEFKTLSFPGDTTTAITNDTANRLQIGIWMGAGTNYTSGALQTTWGAVDNTKRAAGGTNVAGTINNFFQFTGLQMEIGTVVTPYESRRWDDELQICQRYYEKSYDYATAISSNSAIGLAHGFVFDSTVLTRMILWNAQFRVTKRATPTITLWSEDGTLSNVSAYNSSATKIVVSSGPTGNEREVAGGFLTLGSNGAVNTMYHVHWGASADI